MSPASVASCSGSMVPVALSAPNTGLHQPHEHTACARPSPTDRTVVWWSTPPLLQMNDRAGHGPFHADQALDLSDHEPGQLVDVGGLRSGDDVVWSGQAGRLRHARQVLQCGSHGGRAADPGLDQMYAAITGTRRTFPGPFNTHHQYGDSPVEITVRALSWGSVALSDPTRS